MRRRSRIRDACLDVDPCHRRGGPHGADGDPGMGGYELEATGAMVSYLHAHGLVGNSSVLRWVLARPPGRLADFFADELPAIG